MDKAKEKRSRRKRAHQRLRQRVAGAGGRPRLAVYRSVRHIYAQIIDDEAGRTLVQANSLEAEVVNGLEDDKSKRAAARKVGEVVANRAKKEGIAQVVFDRGGNIYHGRVKEVADGARHAGLEF